MRKLVYVLFFFLPLLIAAQEEVAVLRTQLLPQNFYVGDLVEIRVLLRVPDIHQISPPERILQPQWGNINNITVSSEENKVELRMYFVSYVPGIIIFPNIQLGTFQLSGVSVYVNSILAESNKEFRLPRPQLLLPYTFVSLILIVVILIMIPILVVFLRAPIHRIYYYVHNARKLRIPYKNFTKSMKKLRQSIPNMEEKQFYITLTEQFRIFLAREISEKCISATTQELPYIIIEAQLEKPLAQKIASLFRQSDYVKFAEHHTKVSVRENHLKQAENLAQVIYKAWEGKER